MAVLAATARLPDEATLDLLDAATDRLAVGDLRSTTQGRATFTMQFDRYEEVPQSIAGELVDSQTS